MSSTQPRREFLCAHQAIPLSTKLCIACALRVCSGRMARSGSLMLSELECRVADFDKANPLVTALEAPCAHPVLVRCQRLYNAPGWIRSWRKGARLAEITSLRSARRCCDQRM